MLPGRQAFSQQSEQVRERLQTAFDQFRESRLYVQVVVTLVLVAMAWLVHLFPLGLLGRADSAVAWAVTADYEWRQPVTRVQAWAAGQGGWTSALTGLWQKLTPRLANGVSPAATPQPTNQAPSTSKGLAGSSDAALGDSTMAPVLPVEGSLLWEFGWLPQGVSEAFHEGVDFLAKPGTPVVAVQSGTVVAVRQDPRLGLVVEVRHGDVIALYGQVEGVTVRAGDEVKRGKPIGRVSRSAGIEQNMPPHLHFEVRPAATGEPVDPASYLGLGGKQL